MLPPLPWILNWRPMWDGGYLVEKGGDFEDLCNSISVGLIEFLGVEFDASLDGEEADDGPHEFDSVLLLVDVVRDVGLGVVLLSQPVEDVSYQFKVGLAKVLQGDNPAVIQCPQHLAQRTAFSVAHQI